VGCEVESDTGILFQELPHEHSLVSGEIVEDDVDLLIGRAQGDHLFQEADEVPTGVPDGGFPVNASGRGVQRGIQGERSMPVVFKSVALSPARRKRQHRIKTIQRLNGSLLVDTEHSSMLRRVQVQPDNVSRFGFEIRIVVGHVTLQTVWLQASLSPHPMHSVLADVQSCSKLATTPVRGTVLRLFAGSRENSGSQARSQHECRLSRMTGIQTVDSRGKEALLPAADGRCRGPQPLLDGAERGALCQHLDETGAEDISGGQRAGLGNMAEFDSLGFVKYHGIDGHTRLDVSGFSNVYSATVH